jgi:hypothetical protein
MEKCDQCVHESVELDDIRVMFMRAAKTRSLRFKRLFRSRKQRKLFRDARSPAAVASRMHFHPHTVLPVVQLECAGSVGKAEVPMPTSAQSREFALAPDDEAVPLTLLKRLISGQLEICLEQPSPAPPPA